ncbi:MAG: protoheme IX farnesyltransferase [Bdellovibrionaceae bacterium]|nr:protoheme IX farnesyltransferase [Pseudobdellovibrionaceae bacterium]
MKLFADLTKFGIIVFVLLSGAMGYMLSWPMLEAWSWLHFGLTMAALYFFSAGSFALNQAQEWRIDSRMPRTEKRPIPSGRVSVGQAYTLGFGFILIGILAAALVNSRVLALGLFTVIFYNVWYTLYWKRRWAFGAVPGAIPGALPVVIGYAANSSLLLSSECVYAFLIMFLWQMPHFWALAIRFKDDYSAGGIPVLPTKIGTDATVYHIGLYVFAYVALAVASPLFTKAYFFYLFIVLPFAFKVVWEFIKFWRDGATKQRWLPFFLWTNFSVLVFLVGPVIDRWHLGWG